MVYYTMTLNVFNKTKETLVAAGGAMLEGYGYVKAPPADIAANSKGFGGLLERDVVPPGLFGLVAYHTPDPTQNLIIWVEMAAGKSSSNVSIAVIPSTIPIDGKLASGAYEGTIGNFTTGTLEANYTKDGNDYLIKVIPQIVDPGDNQATTNITFELYRGSLPQ